MKILSGTEVEIVQEFALEEIAQEYDLVPLGCSFEVNGMPGHEKTIVKPGDQVTAVQEELPEEFPAEAPEDVQQTETAMLETAAASEMVKEFSAGTGNDLFWPGGITVTVNGKPINLPPKSTGYMFIDIFNYIDFDLTAPEGIIALKLNGNDANYTDMIKAGDLIDIYWKK
jgi:sulfur carrier protein ThiS